MRGLWDRVSRLFGQRRRTDELLRNRFYHFQRLLEANDAALAHMGELSEVLASPASVCRGRGRPLVHAILDDTRLMIESLQGMAPGRYGALWRALERVESSVAQALGPVTAQEGAPPYTIELAEVTMARLPDVGGKMARLGEVKNVMGLPVPDGFCVTWSCFAEALAGTGLLHRIQTRLRALDPGDVAEVERASEDIHAWLSQAALAPAAVASILGAYDALRARLGSDCLLAVRSSAADEDDVDHSFAGLYTSLLGVRRDRLVEACWSVFVSWYSPQALVYRLLRGVGARAPAMSIGCMAMLPARTSGTLFTADPAGFASGFLVEAVHGLGAPLVGGEVVPQQLVIDPRRPAEAQLVRAGAQHEALVLGRDGLESRALSAEVAEAPLLEVEEVAALARYAAAIAEHFGAPQDLEWVVSASGQPFILQARSLSHPLDAPPYPSPDVAAPAVASGDVASRGAGSGPVCVVPDASAASACANGSVLVIRRASPAYARVLHQIAAVVAEAGTSTGHLAIIARELGVPMLVNVEGATDRLRDGDVVTVDAARGRVLAGHVPELLQPLAQRGGSSASAGTPECRALGAAAACLTPLNLTDALLAHPEDCRTAHDVTRYCHEMAMREMFELNRPGRRRSRVRRLEYPVPLELFVIDVGGGVAPAAPERQIAIADITSTPLRALLTGMMTPGLPWTGAVPVDLRGFAGLLLNTMVDSERARAELGSEAYALASSEYVNFSARMGYHFASLDAYVSRHLHRNYVSYRFRGGAAGSQRRARRARFIARVLQSWGFQVEQHADQVSAGLRKLDEADMRERLEDLGRLLGAVRNADLSMYSDELVDAYADAFLAGASSPVHAASRSGYRQPERGEQP